jgi:serine/threonine protein kinase
VSLRLLRLDAKGSRMATLVGAAGRQAQSLRHPKLLAVLDVVRGDDELGIVSEYMDGEDLGSLLRSAALSGVPIPPGVALAIARDALETLCGVLDERARRVPSAQDGLASSIHGGLSPDGVFVATFGEALLTELGVAGAACRHAWFAEHTHALPYRAPEQLEGPRVADQRADVHAVGVLLWEMLANRALFGGADRLKRQSSHARPTDTQSVLKEVLAASVPDLRTVQRPGAPVPTDVAAFVARATAQLPLRFQSLREMLDALRELPSTRMASAESIATTVDRLARNQLDARRARIEHASGARIVASIPPSSRDTDVPDPPSRPISLLVPPGEPDPPCFPPTEAPTAGGSGVVAVSRPGAAAGPRAAPARDLSPLPVEVVPLEELEDVEQPPAPAESPFASDPALAANILGEAEPRRRSRAPVAIGLVILLLGAGMLFWAFGRNSPIAAVPTAVSVAVPQPSAAPTAASTAPEIAETEAPAETVVDAGSTQEPTHEVARPEAAESHLSARPDKQEDRPAEGVQAPARGQKGFRPSGI